MLKAIWSVTLLFFPVMFGHGYGPQNRETKDCPTVVVVCPDDVFTNKSTVRFEARVNGVSPSQGLKYRWTVYSRSGVPKPKIKSGQGTASILVKASRAARRGLTLTVTVDGFPANCQNQASCATGIASLR